MRVVKRNIGEAWPIVNQQIARVEKLQLEEKYRLHIIDYLAQQQILSQLGQILNKLDYSEQHKLDYSIFLKYFRKYRSLVKDEVLKRYRQLEEERLQGLRQPVIRDEFKEEPKSEFPIPLLEVFALKKLPTRKKRVIFSDRKEENIRLEDVWLQIAEDVSKIGLLDAVAQKWQHEINLPSSIPIKERNRLILLRIETVLKQLDMFVPPRTLSFEQLNNWLHPQPSTIIPKKEISYPPLSAPIRIEIPETVDLPVPESPFDERWLEQEIAKEELETRRFLDTPEERERRRREGLIIPSLSVSRLSKFGIENLKNAGALYDNGDWLVLTPEDLEKYTPEISDIKNAIKPKLLIGIGTRDYTKDWMHKAFIVKTVTEASAVRNLMYSFMPDAFMIYKSSCGKKLYEEVVNLARETGIPLLVFDRGFVDVLLSAQRQNLQWFIDAYHQRRSLRRLNPWKQYQAFLNY